MNITLYEFGRVAITKYHGPGGSTEVYFLMFLKAGDQGVNRASPKASQLGIQIGALLLCPHVASLLCACPWWLWVSKISSYKDISQVGLGPS